MSLLKQKNNLTIASDCFWVTKVPFFFKRSSLKGTFVHEAVAWRSCLRLLRRPPAGGLLAMVILLFIISPKITGAKTVSFKEKSWDIITFPFLITENNFVHNDFNLLKLSQAVMSGAPFSQTNQLLDAETLNITKQIAQAINQPAKDAAMVISGNRATIFDPGQTGQSLDLYALRELLLSNASAIDLPVFLSSPKVSLSQTNNLGINELIATGVSNFTGSSSNRIKNITVGAGRFNGLIVAPGEEFSFNKNLGDVDAKHGYVPEIVIKPEGLTPEFGGGLCQVSTTAFRAAMNSGLPITARRNHSFAVAHYAPQGTDATIYPGSSDLKFINNLSSSLLIRTRVEGRLLYFDYFGTKDDRVVTFDGPTQYDKKSSGAMKATWTRHVTLNGQTTDQTFNSNYLPPAQFPRISTVAPSTPNPDTPPPTQPTQ